MILIFLVAAQPGPRPGPGVQGHCPLCGRWLRAAKGKWYHECPRSRGMRIANNGQSAA